MYQDLRICGLQPLYRQHFREGERIELSGLGRTALSAGDFTVTAIPVVTAVTPTSVLAAGRITLTGTGLDLVREVRLNSTVLTIVSQSTTSLVVDLVAGATSGVLTLVDAGGTARAVAQQVTIVAPMAITSFSPASIVTGQALTINGTGLDRAVGVTFANGATANIATRSGSTRITVTVPDAAASGALRVRGNANDEVVSASPLTVIPAIRVDANAVYRVGAGRASPTRSPPRRCYRARVLQVGARARAYRHRSA